jgi:hypothetical protein
MEMLQQLRSFPTTAGRTLASNPGVPMQGLLRLAGPYPFQVWNNPAFKLQLVATPGFLETIPLRVTARFAGCRDMDEKIIRRLASSRSKPIAVRAAAARNPSCPMDMMHDYLRHAWKVRRALAQNPNLPSDLHEKLAGDPRTEVKAALARRKDVKPKLLVDMACKVRNDLVLQCIINNESAPPMAVDIAQKNQSPRLHRYEDDFSIAWSRMPVVHTFNGLDVRWVGPLLQIPSGQRWADMCEAGWGYLKTCGWQDLLPDEPLLTRAGQVSPAWRDGLYSAAHLLAVEGKACGIENDPERWLSWLCWTNRSTRQHLAAMSGY